MTELYIRIPLVNKTRGISCQIPVHDVAPRAVSIAEAIETINCAINLAVSFFVITHLLSLRINHRGRIVVVVIVATTSLRTTAAL